MSNYIPKDPFWRLSMLEMIRIFCEVFRSVRALNKLRTIDIVQRPIRRQVRRPPCIHRHSAVCCVSVALVAECTIFAVRSVARDVYPWILVHRLANHWPYPDRQDNLFRGT